MMYGVFTHDSCIIFTNYTCGLIIQDEAKDTQNKISHLFIVDKQIATPRKSREKSFHFAAQEIKVHPNNHVSDLVNYFCAVVNQYY